MVNATKGLLISCDIPMAQFIINLNASLPASQKFIIHILDNTHIWLSLENVDVPTRPNERKKRTSSMPLLKILKLTI
ncbi:hypothetical protein OIU78_009963 [Salix suchowensis]|nr:hypothetical protein OIU78_009963 [Salix suchowensis]